MLTLYPHLLPVGTHFLNLPQMTAGPSRSGDAGAGLAFSVQEEHRVPANPCKSMRINSHNARDSIALHVLNGIAPGFMCK